MFSFFTMWYVEIKFSLRYPIRFGGMRRRVWCLFKGLVLQLPFSPFYLMIGVVNPFLNVLVFTCSYAQVTSYPEPCTTFSHCTWRITAMGRQYTTRVVWFIGHLKRSTHFATLCTALTWSGKIPTLSPPRLPYKQRGEIKTQLNACIIFKK